MPQTTNRKPTFRTPAAASLQAMAERDYENGAQRMAFELRNEGDGSKAELMIYDIIGPDFWTGGGCTAKDIAEQLRDMDAKVINVRINSVGGSVFEGIGIYNALARHDARIEVDIDGFALSIASVIAMAGDEIRIAENGQMMIHDPTAFAGGTAADMRKVADMLDTTKKTLVSTYTARSNMDAAEVSDLMSEETWFTAEDAVEKGLADSVTPAKRIAACGDLSRFKHVPADVAACVTNTGKEPRMANATKSAPKSSTKPAVKNEGETPAEEVAATTDAAEPAAAEGAESAAAANSAAPSPDPVKVERERCAAINAAFPDDPAFAQKAIAEGMSIVEAKAARFDAIKNKPAAKPAGVKPLETSNEGDKPDAAGDFESIVAANKAKGMTAQAATSKAVREHPEAHAEFLRTHNEAHGNAKGFANSRFAS